MNSATLASLRLSALALLSSASLVLGAEPDSGGNNDNQPTNDQHHGSVPTGPAGGGGQGGQGSSGDSIGCCCCCPTQKTFTFTVFGLTFTLHAYPGYDYQKLADPVVVSSGKLYVPYTDVEIPGPGRFNNINLAFIRSYNNRDNSNDSLGWGWVTNLDISLSFSGGVASFKDGDGSRYYMQPKSSILFADGHTGTGWEHGPWTVEYVYPQLSYVLTKTFGTKYFFNIYTQRLTKIEDRQGHRITYNRADGVRVSSLVDSAGQTLTFAYNPTTGRLWKVTDPLARTWEYIQTGDNLTQVIAPMSRVTTYGYIDTDIHNLTSLLDPHGRTTRWFYWTSAGEDRVKQELLHDGRHSDYVYYPSIEASDFYDTAGQLWQHTYSNPGMVTKTIDPLGHIWEYEYNDQKKMTLMRDPYLREMRWEWDSRQNLKKVIGRETGATWSIGTSASNHFPQAVTDALGKVHPAPMYDAQMNVNSVTDVAGKTTAYTYYPAGHPSAGLVETYKDRNDKVTTVTWKPTGSPETITDATLRTVTFTYDAAGRRTSASTPGAPLMEWFYDAADRLTSVKRAGVTIQTVAWVDNPQKVTTTDAASHATEYTFDTGGRVFEISSPGYTTKTKYQYNLRGQVWKVTDTAGRVVEKLYDIAGRLWKVIEPPPAAGGASLVTEYEYYDDDTLKSLKDPGGQKTLFAWDPVTLKKTTTFPDLTTEIHTYDGKGRMCNFRNRAGDDRAKFYNDLDLLTSQSCPTCGASFKYDHEGRLTFVNDAIAGDLTPGNTTDDFAFEYDDAGRLLKAKQPGVGNVPQAVSVEYTYDTAGRLQTQKWPDASTATYAYDTAGHFHTITRGSDVWTYGYNSDDTRESLTLPNGVTGDYYYDAAMRLETLTWTASNSTLLNSNGYVWNAANELSSHSQTNGHSGSRTYGHDGISRLKTSTSTGTLFTGEAARTWNYDDAGNRTSVVTGGTTVTYAPKAGEWNLYDTVGGLTQTYDAKKNLKSDGVLGMEYDADNRLTAIKTPATGTPTWTQDLIYDWMGRLIKKTVTQGGSATTTRYYYSGWTVLAEVNESGGAYLHKYVHGPAIDELLSDETGGTTYHVLRDMLGSTTALVTTGSTVAQRYTYDPYGSPTVRSANGSPSPAAPITNYLYTGREYDKLSGLYNYRNRFYHPGLGRFLQPDPIGFAGGPNPFGYCGNSPLSRIDPSGLNWLDDIIEKIGLKSMGAAAGAALGYACGAVAETSRQFCRDGDVNWEDVHEAGKQGAVIGGVAGAIQGPMAVLREAPLALAASCVGGAIYGLCEEGGALHQNNPPRWADLPPQYIQ